MATEALTTSSVGGAWTGVREGRGIMKTVWGLMAKGHSQKGKGRERRGGGGWERGSRRPREVALSRAGKSLGLRSQRSAERGGLMTRRLYLINDQTLV